MISDSIKQSFSDLYIVGKRLNEINKTGFNTTDIIDYTSAINGLTQKQAQLLLSTQSIDAAQKQAIISTAALAGTTGTLTTSELTSILTSQKRNSEDAKALLLSTGLITANTAEANSTNLVTAAKLKELVQTGQLQKAEAQLIATKAGVTLQNEKEAGSFIASIGAKAKGFGQSLKAVGTGLLTVASAHPVIAGITAALTIGVGAAMVAKVKHEQAAQEIKEAYEAAKNSIDEINSSFNNKKSTVESIAQEYAKLAQGVDLNNNENINLSTDEYTRFLDLSNQLSNTFPTLTNQFDENGNAILNLSGNVDTIVQSLNNLIVTEQQLANQQILTNMPDLYAGFRNDIKDLDIAVDEARKSKEQIEEAYKVVQQFAYNTTSWTQGGLLISGDSVTNLAEYTNALETLGIEYDKIVQNFNGNQLIQIEADFDSNSTEVHDIYTSIIQSAIDSINYAEQKLESEESSFFNQYLKAWLPNTSAYPELNANLQNVIQQIISNFDWTKLPDDIDTWDELTRYFEKNIINQIDKVKNNSTISQAFAQIFTNDNLSIDEQKAYIEQIQNYFGEDNVITVALQPKIVEIENLENQVDALINRFGSNSSNLLKKFFERNSINTQEEIDYFEEVTKYARNAEHAIRLYTEAKNNIGQLSFTESVSQIQNLSSGLEQLDKIYADVYDKDTFDWSSILNNEDFASTFGNLTDVTGEYKNVYEDFIKTIANNPDDIEACQSTFNDLATAYIYNSDALKNLSEDSLDVAATMLKQQGVANATEIVQAAYAKQLIATAIETGNISETTKAYIQRLYEQSGGAEYATSMLQMLQLQMIDVNSTTFDFTQQLSQLESLANAALTTSSALSGMFNGGILSETTEVNGVTMPKAVAHNLIGELSRQGNINKDKVTGNIIFTGTEEVFNQALKEAEKLTYEQARNSFNNSVSQNPIEVKAPQIKFVGGEATNSAKASNSSSGGSSSDDIKDYYDTYQELIDDRQADIDKAIKKDELLTSRYEEAIRTHDYTTAQNLKNEIIANKEAIQNEYSAAATEIRTALNTQVLPAIFKIAPQLEGIDVGDWSEVTIKNISENLPDEVKTEFDSLVSAAQAMYEKVGSKIGEGEWAEAFGEQYKEIDTFTKEYYENLFDSIDESIELRTEEVDAIDNAISKYDDELDTIETLAELKGDSLDKYVDSYEASTNKINAYAEKEIALQKELLANQQALARVQAILSTLSPTDPTSVETYDALISKSKEYKEAIQDINDALLQNEQDQLKYELELHQDLVDKLSDIYEKQRDEAEKALEERQEAELNALEEAADAAQKASDAKIEALQKEREELEKNNEEYNAAKTLNEKIRELQKVKRDQSYSFINDEGEEEAIYDVNKANELEQEIQDLFQEQAYNDRLDSIDAQIEEEENNADKIQEQYDQQIEALKQAQEKEKEAFDIYWDYILSETNLNNEARILAESNGYKNSINALDDYLNNMQLKLDEANEPLFNKGKQLTNSLMKGMFADLDEYIKVFVAQTQNLQASNEGKNLVGTNSATALNKNISDVIKQMFTNSQLWSKYNAIGDVVAKKQLEQLNQQLGASIGAKYDSTSGTWTINGKNIYDDLERATRDNINETIDNTDITDLLNDTERKSNTLLNTVNTALTDNTNSLSSLEESIDDNTKALNNSGSSNNNSSNSSNSSSSSSSGSNISLENASISVERSNGYTYYTARNPQNYNEILGTKTVDRNGNVIEATGLYSGELNKKPSNNNTDTSKPTTPPSDTETTPEKKKYYLYTFNDNGVNKTIESLQTRYDNAFKEAVEKGLLSSSAKFIGSTGYIYKHDGIASGYIGDTPLTNEKKNLLKDIALGNTQLKSDEVPAVLQKGEGVFTVEQLNNLANAFIEQRTPINPLTIKRNIANNIVSPTQSQQIVEKGDSYVFQNVTIKSDNLDTFVKQIRLYSKR